MSNLIVRSINTLIIKNKLRKETLLLYSTSQQHLRTENVEQKQPARKMKILKVAIIGMPNAGKSTFINTLMDRKVCPTSSKVHTTRSNVQAIFTEDDSQIIFMDTPGLVTDRMTKRYKLENSFMTGGQKSLQQSDVIGVIHDVGNEWTREKLDIKLIKLLEGQINKPSFLVFNKVDILRSKRKLLDLTRSLTMNCIDGRPIVGTKSHRVEINENFGWPHFKEIFMVSSLTGDGLSRVRRYLIENAKPGEWLFSEEVWSDQSPEELIIKTVKAVLLDYLPQEIPYLMEPVLEHFESIDQGPKSIVVIVKCPSERIAKLVAGGAGGRLRQMTEKVQKDLQDVFQQYLKVQIILDFPKETPVSLK